MDQLASDLQTGGNVWLGLFGGLPGLQLEDHLNTDRQLVRLNGH